VTSTIPIVMGFDNDPVGNGFAASLARPGGNITGLSTLAPEISGKQLELMKEIVHRLSRVAVFGTSRQPGNAQSLQEVELAAKAFKVSFNTKMCSILRTLTLRSAPPSRGVPTPSSYYRLPSPRCIALSLSTSR